MEDWIKKQADEFALPPKGDNWDHISATLDADKKAKSKKRRILVFFWILPAVAFFLGYQYHKSANPIASKQNSKQLKQQSSEGLTLKHNEIHLEKPDTIKAIANILSDEAVKGSKNSLAQETKKAKANPNKLANKSKSVLSHFVAKKETDLLPGNASIPFDSNLDKRRNKSITVFGPSLTPKPLKGFLVKPASKMLLDEDSLVDFIPSLISTKRALSSIYVRYGLGSNARCGTKQSAGSQTLFGITGMRLNQNVFHDFELGATFKLNSKIGLSFGLGTYSAKWSTNVGQSVYAQEGSIPSNNVTTVNPTGLKEGLNYSGDTLYLQQQGTFNDYDKKDLYALSNQNSFENRMNGVFIPVQINWELISFRRFSVSANLGSQLMLERKSDILTYSNYMVYSRKQTKHSFLQLQSIQADAGLSFEYRKKYLGLFVAPSFQFNAYQSNKLLKTSSGNICQFKVGVGVNYYLRKGYPR